MTGHDVRETHVDVLLRCEELRSHLEATKDRLNLAAFQLEELTRILLERKPSSFDLISRPWLDELAMNQVVGDVIEAGRRLNEARMMAAKLGINLPQDL